MNKLSEIDITPSLQPLFEMVDINRETVEKLTELQTEYFSHCLESGLEQFRRLIDCAADPQACTQAQLDHLKQLERWTNEAVEQEYQTIHQAHDKISNLVENSYKHQSRFLNEIYPDPKRPQ